ncbi:MAG: UDP-N-acetylmuramate:L-alanyl-gamma-D-glutamyl-meso-diaminopimelate ligase [Bdellovibrionales bacterium]
MHASLNKLKPGAHIHMMGICGTAMGSLAGILKSMGYKVSGSDQNVYPPMSTQLTGLGIHLQEGYRPENLQPRPDLVIVGNVISKTNPEAAALLQSDIPYTSLPKAMGEFVIGERQSMVIAGTHGKTTTTSMMAWVAETCEMSPGFLIGGIPENFSHSFRAPAANWFVIEGDEYDTAFFDKVPKFVHYRPRHVILTSIEFDHADIYADLQAVKDAFQALVELIPADGTLVACHDDDNVLDVITHAKCRVVTYGLKGGDYRAVERAMLMNRSHFAVQKDGEKIADVALKVFGEHNTLNALAVYALVKTLGWPESKVLQGLASFSGVKRRQQFLGEPGGVAVIEDFAHHPTAVRMTIESIRERYPSRRVLAVFEPRSATSRRKVFQRDYVEAFSRADASFIAEAFDQSKIQEDERFSSDQLVQDLKKKGVNAHLGANVDQLVQQIRQTARKGDVLLIMSNGGFGGIYQKLLAALA